MSKITKALEKAARERLQAQQETVTVPAVPVTVPILPVVPLPSAAWRLDVIAPAGEIQIDPHIVSATASTSPIAEQYRILRTNLKSLNSGRLSPKVILLTSAVSGEGKSVTSINLALTFARQEHLRVVLVDADLRQSSVPRWLGLKDGQPGLSTVLKNGGELNGSLVSLQSPKLAILPAGPAVSHPAELLESVAMKRLLATLKAQFDLVIIDAPPILPVTDPGILASQVDGVLLVVRAGKTQRRTVLEAQERLKKARANLLGCVLTHVEYYMPGYHRYYHYYRSGKGNGHAQRPASTPETN